MSQTDLNASVTPEDEENARKLLRWMLDPALPPFTAELEIAACACATKLLQIAKKAQPQ